MDCKRNYCCGSACFAGELIMTDDTFTGYHPAVNFLYFVLVIGCSMFVMHPVFLALSFLGGMSYYLYLKKAKALKTMLWMMLPVFLITAIINPLFTHKGVTVLAYFKNGNALTLESILYGLAAGTMMVSVLNWFSCYQTVMTSDKFIYLFGKIIPALSLVLSMVFRFVPKFQKQLQKVSDSQKCIGRDVTNGNMLDKAHHGIKILSVMTTWALENSVETADSMKSRGYGLRGRTNCSIYRFDTRDKILTGILTGMGLVVIAGIAAKTVRFLFYPMIVINKATPFALAVYLCYGALCLLPVTVNIIEDIKWHYLKSKI